MPRAEEAGERGGSPGRQPGVDRVETSPPLPFLEAQQPAACGLLVLVNSHLCLWTPHSCLRAQNTLESPRTKDRGAWGW